MATTKNSKKQAKNTNTPARAKAKAKKPAKPAKPSRDERPRKVYVRQGVLHVCFRGKLYAPVNQDETFATHASLVTVDDPNKGKPTVAKAVKVAPVDKTAAAESWAIVEIEAKRSVKPRRAVQLTLFKKDGTPVGRLTKAKTEAKPRRAAKKAPAKKATKRSARKDKRKEGKRAMKVVAKDNREAKVLARFSNILDL